MSDFNFTLIIHGDVEPRLDDLFEAGCDDATFGSVDGTWYAEFDRSAPALLDAVASSIAAIESIPGLSVVRVEPDDLVTAAEIAARLGRSRESVRLLIAGERGPGGFPAPVSHVRTRYKLWRWSDVAAWLSREDDQHVVRQARLVAATNAALELRSNLRQLSHDEREFVTNLEQAKVS
jgi:hypothetical protein